MKYDKNKRIEARLTFFRPTGTVEVEHFESEKDAKAWIARRCRQLDRDGFATDRDHLKREVSVLPGEGSGGSAYDLSKPHPKGYVQRINPVGEGSGT